MQRYSISSCSYALKYQKVTLTEKEKNDKNLKKTADTDDKFINYLKMYSINLTKLKKSTR